MRQTPFIQSALSILWKDLRAEMRSRELVSSMGLFALLSILVFSFALELTGTLLSVNEELREINSLLEELGQAQLETIDPLNISTIVSGMFWVTVVFAVILGLNRSLSSEREQGNLDAMLIAPIHRSAIFVGKMTAIFIFGLVVAIVLLPVITILFSVNLVQPLLIGVVILGLLGFSSIGTLMATMAVQTRSREALLPIMLLPTSLPVLLSVVRASNGIIANQPVELWGGWISMLLLLDLIYVGMSFLSFPFVVED